MKEHEEEFLGQFRHLHQHPELSFQEHETTAYIKKKLEGWGIEILDIGLETGVVGLLKGGKEGYRVLHFVRTLMHFRCWKNRQVSIRHRTRA